VMYLQGTTHDGLQQGWCCMPSCCQNGMTARSTKHANSKHSHPMQDATRWRPAARLHALAAAALRASAWQAARNLPE
jgi:hypothetical protein